MKSKSSQFVPKEHQSRWSHEEQKLFFKGFQLFGRKWSLYPSLIPSRSAKQVRSHAQKILGREERKRCGKCTGLVQGDRRKGRGKRDVAVQCDLEEGGKKEEVFWETELELEA